MLKKIVYNLLERYEFPGNEILTAGDVCEELQEILDVYHEWEISDYLQEAIDRFAVTQRNYNRYCGHCGDDGSEDFIAEVKRIVGYK